MLIYDQFGIIQNFQTSPIPQTSFLVGTFFTVSHSKTALAKITHKLRPYKIIFDDYLNSLKLTLSSLLSAVLSVCPCVCMFVREDCSVAAAVDRSQCCAKSISNLLNCNLHITTVI